MIDPADRLRAIRSEKRSTARMYDQLLVKISHYPVGSPDRINRINALGFLTAHQLTLKACEADARRELNRELNPPSKLNPLREPTPAELDALFAEAEEEVRPVEVSGHVRVLHDMLGRYGASGAPVLMADLAKKLAGR